MNRYRIPDEVNRDLFTDPTPGLELIQRCFSSPAGKKASTFSLLSFISGFRAVVAQVLVMAFILVGSLGWAIFGLFFAVYQITGFFIFHILAGILILILCTVSRSAHSTFQVSPRPRLIKRAGLMARIRGVGLMLYSAVFIGYGANLIITRYGEEGWGVIVGPGFWIPMGVLILLHSVGWLACGAYHRRLYRFAHTGKYKSSKRPPYFWMGVSVSFYFLTFNFFSALSLLSSMTWFKHTHREIVSSSRQ